MNWNVSPFVAFLTPHSAKGKGKLLPEANFIIPTRVDMV
jgi:hypothetical protein